MWGVRLVASAQRMRLAGSYHGRMRAVVPDDSGLRIGDVQRDAAVEALRAHYAEGRLSPAEFEERMGAALVATTVAELRPLFADLPRDSEAVNGVSVWRAPPKPVRHVSPLGVLQRWMIFLAPVLWLLVFTGWSQWWLAYLAWAAVFVVVNRLDHARDDPPRPELSARAR